MASVASLREHLVEELNDLLNAEQQLIEALPMMAEKASQRELKAAFKSHLAQTRTHERRVSQALKQLGEQASGKTCEAMEGLLEEGQEVMSSADPGALLDAMMITAAQKVEHYEIATYGTVRTYAQVLGERGVSKLLDQTLKEEKAADKKLTSIAEGAVNKKAAKELQEHSESMTDTASDMLEKGAQLVGSTVGSAMKTVRSVMPGGQASDRSNPGSRTKRGANGSRATKSSRNVRSSGRSHSRNR
jgi:ferritin-like metal-binding protein YciE